MTYPEKSLAYYGGGWALYLPQFLMAQRHWFICAQIKMEDIFQINNARTCVQLSTDEDLPSVRTLVELLDEIVGVKKGLSQTFDQKVKKRHPQLWIIPPLKFFKKLYQMK